MGNRYLFSSLTLVSTLLFGCVGGPTKDFYKPTGNTPHEPVKGNAALIESSNFRQDVDRYIGMGYVLLGTSDYRGKYPEMIELSTQAKKVGASVVLFTGEYLHTLSGVRSVTVPNPAQTVTSQTSGNVYGYGGFASYQEQTTTTVPGGYSTHQIPYAIDRFEVHAAFLSRGPAPEMPSRTPASVDESSSGGIGVIVDYKPSGLLVLSVVPEGPAARSGIRAGYFITEINDFNVEGMTQEQALRRLRGAVGSTVFLTVRHPAGSETIQITREKMGNSRL